ncbi:MULTISPECIES: tripartite tricarboxylate transporter substrate binding protein [Rhodobacterales]|jgi:tripartite-type tricarboxylate transporter receptor subunit TctC|uniref:Transporter n=1 Tax=Phaeobacter gallaeciensis TaxID=60890 RepID=A0A1B0ZUL0_9RHOB|nr:MULTISPECIES: tripartite tricarboxylate transporter substrate binding protein [Phaeobacter]MEE2635183.1 tripartite tricarboxylate transporter substrate binding protein [Pseudomonadota bacterium]ANP37801.1 transporter [Phaeobacter gallaeciensis]MDE4096942.1 tripartite tricarboxylate transporter substrate binding protein [Phaeobacter gallaeciensis]MDE4105764.1 tripartite tricarboxylate transporter substrate binding protein [Phaeobacter gallaeciensis]MDE4110209.1 tripartite tricarboxylate tran
MKLTTIVKGAAAATALGLSAVAAQAEYPEKPVNFIVPWPPGDLEDVLTRMIAEDFQNEYGVAAAVVNKPGGGGGPFPGAIEVANAPADGYTIGSFVIGVPVVGHQIDIPPLTPAKFDPLGIFLTYPFVIATSGDAPYSSMEELAAYAKENDVALGHFGDVLTPTQVTKAFAKNAGFEWGSDAAFDALDCNTLASGDADVINTTLQLILPCLDDVKVLVSITDERIPLVPDAPAIGELDDSLNIALWNGLFVTKDTPQDVRDKIIAVAEKTVMSERAQNVAKETGALIYWQNAEDSAARVAADIDTMARIGSILE